MFEFLNDFYNYEERKVANWEEGDRMVDTARVSDGEKPYETAFQHPEYNDGKMIIVEAYDTKEKAQTGHERWLKVMTEGPLPDALTDCCNAGVAVFCEALGSEMTFKRQPR